MATGCDFLTGILGDDNENSDEPSVPAEATGGTVFVDGNYEIHVFSEPGEKWTLKFSDERDALVADILVVAGGGGSGGQKLWDNDFPGGGGAGGLLYEAAYELELEDGVLTGTVGEGGPGGSKSGSAGNDGGASTVGIIEVPGGGGGGGADGLNGNPGGSGGGGSAGPGNTRGNPGASQKIGNMQGNPGGYGSNNYSGNDCGGGGGGAGGSGVGGGNNRAGTGGLPWVVTDDTAWIETVTGTSEFSRGGRGGAPAKVEVKNGANYGDGGSVGGNLVQNGGAGHSGVVVIRFERGQAEQTEQAAE
jgi:hypothetical protein